jgi:hypothetical protein
MRAIIHLGFFRAAYQVAASSETVSGRHSRINGLRLFVSEQFARKSLPKFHPTRINRLQASQNAAALLSDLVAVDIR